MKCTSPIDNSVLVEIEDYSSIEAVGIIDKAKKAQRDWKKVDIKKRIEIVIQAIKYLGDDNEVVVELAKMMGRPIRFGGEFGGVWERTQYVEENVELAIANLEAEDSKQFERRIIREPHGIVFVIAPWNYPYLTAVNTIVPALIVGNAVLLKPASQTILTAKRFEKAFEKAGLPKGLFQTLYLDHQTTSKLISEKRFDFINFTGSVNGGKAMEIAAAGTFTPLGLELGGKDPGYVMEDADLDKAVEVLMDAAMYNAGQCCCGIERIYVNEALYDEFVKKSVETVSKLKLGNPLEASTTLGPMANIRFAEEVRSQIKEAVSAGAKEMIDPGLFPQDGGTYLMPQILTKVNHSMRVMREESFGPVVGIMKVKDDEEAIKLMNDSPYGLTASLWTKNAERAAKIGAELETGTVFMNRADYLDPALCWTGCKDTGKGGTLSYIGLQNLTRPKSYHLRKNI